MISASVVKELKYVSPFGDIYTLRFNFDHNIFLLNHVKMFHDKNISFENASNS